jgi:hypothetical protein
MDFSFIVALVMFMIGARIGRSLVYRISAHSDSVEAKKNCQTCSTGVPYILRYKEEVKRDTFCNYHKAQASKIDFLEKALLDGPSIVPVPGMEHELMIERAGGFGRYRNTNIKPLPVTARVLTSNDVREVEELPYEIVVDEYLGVIKHVPSRPRAIAAPEDFTK